MQNYRNYQAQPSQRSPQATPARRGPGPMVQNTPAHAAPPPLTQHQLQQQHFENVRRQELARRQARKPTDRDIPDEISEAVVGDAVERYKKLRDVEKRLDAVMMRKRLDITDNLQRRYTRREGILRVWISNTAEGQPWQVMEEGNEDGTFELEENQATFRVKIEGRLLEDPDDDDESEQPAPAHRPRLSSFFKAINVEFDRNPNLQPDGYNQIEWRKPQLPPGNPGFDPANSEASFDMLEFTRKADENINVTINLVRDEKNERFKVSPELAEILDTDEEDRAGAVQGVWEYCRAMNLQEDDDKRKIACDEPLRRVFKQDMIYFPQVPDLLVPHLQPLPPIRLPYTIRVDKPYIAGTPDYENGEESNSEELKPSRPTVYDVRVPLQNPLHYQLTRFHGSKAHLNDLQTIVRTDDDLALLVQKIHQTNAKRKFYENLAKDPTSFVKRWISSQQRDLEVILAEATRGGGEDGSNESFRRGGSDGVWGSDLARESVGLWLARNQKLH